MSSDRKIVGSIIFFTIAIVGVIMVLGGESSPSGTTSSPTGTGEVVRNSSQSRGPETAKVTLVEFSDFQCPACGAEYPVLEKIVAEYNDRIRFVYRHFPLAMHANAEIAALASEAAGDQGKFWEMHHKLFEGQSQWSVASDPKQIFVAYAREIGLNEDKFRNDLSDAKIKDRVVTDMNDAELLGVDRTPTLYLNGQKITGGLDYATLKPMIDQALAK